MTTRDDAPAPLDPAPEPHTGLIGRTLVDLGEKLLGRMPVVRAIYRGLKQVFETLFSGSGSSFRRVGLVEFPSPGMWSIVLISQSPSVEIANSLPGQEIVTKTAHQAGVRLRGGIKRRRHVVAGGHSGSRSVASSKLGASSRFWKSAA